MVDKYQIGQVVGYVDVDRRMRPLAAAFAELGPQQEPLELHSMDPWLIGQCHSGAHERAKRSSEREGFECWWPEWCEIKTPPLSTMSSKTRHKAHLMVSQRFWPLLGTYVFMRKMWGDFSAVRLYDLDGMSGLCMFGEHVAKAEDYEIELLRLKTAQHKFDHTDRGTARLRYNTPSFGKYERGTSPAKLLGSVDESGRLVQFFRKLGRVTRIITSSAAASEVRAQVGTTPSAKL